MNDSVLRLAKDIYTGLVLSRTCAGPPAEDLAAQALNYANTFHNVVIKENGNE